MATPAFLICSEEPRTCPTTAKRDWCAGQLGKMFMLHKAVQRKFQKIYLGPESFLDYVLDYVFKRSKQTIQILS